MSARWTERQDGRNAGRADTASAPATPTPGGCLEVLPAVPIVAAVVYYAVHALVWLGRVMWP